MALTYFSKALATAGLLSASLFIAGAAKASVLVEPVILRDDEPVPVTDSTPAAPTQDIVGVASSTEGFSTLVSAIQAANIGSILTGDGPYTVFAPTDAAFFALPDGALDALLMPQNRDLLVKLLYNHVSYGDLTSDKLEAGSLDTFDGAVEVAINPTGVSVGGANVVQADVEASNGVIHAVDKVLLPAGFQEQLQARMTSGSETASSSSSSASSTTTVTRSTLQQGVVERPAAPVAPVAPAEPAAAQEPVRGLW